MTIRLWILAAGMTALYSCQSAADKNTQQQQASISQGTLQEITDSVVKPMEMADNSLTSLDWPGIYEGILPCADCEGIKTTIQIDTNKTFEVNTVYLGKDKPLKQAKKGTFSWNASGGSITLDGITDGPNQYLVGENKLIQLDMQGQRITGNLASKYELAKLSGPVSNVPDALLIETYWKLTEIMGKPVSGQADGKREAHVILKKEKNRVQGHGGCNAFSGTYELKDLGRISFSAMASTKMACPNLDQESAFMSVFQKADGYIIKGDTLQLIKARMAPLAKFQAVYLR